MILIDLSQLAISNLMMSPNLSKGEVDSSLIKHMILNSIRAYNKRFRVEYGDIVICCDSQNYWRKDIFPLYKAHRKEEKKNSKFDWGEVFQTIKEFKEDLCEYFPYKVIEVDRAEGDDIVAILSANIKTKNLILGSDKDYLQLQVFKHIKQFSPTKKKWIVSEDPLMDRFRLICKGDKADGIPNIRSDDDSIMENKRQKPISEKNIKEWYNQDPKQFCTTMDMYNNFQRNQQLICFGSIPKHIKEDALKQFEIEPKGNKVTIQKYFSDNRMRHLVSYLNDF